MLTKPSFRTIWLLAAVCLLEVSAPHAQPALLGLDPNKSLWQYHTEVWNTDDGLPQNTVHAITQTPDGYIWASTQEGIARFDGVQFEVFEKRNVPALRNNHASTSITDRSGALWIGTIGGGLTRYADGAFETFTTEDGLPSNQIGALHEDDRGHLWIGTSEGLSRYDGRHFQIFRTEDGLRTNQIMSITHDGTGTLWVGTGSGLSRYAGGRFETVPELAKHAVLYLHRDRRGTLWIGTNQGLVHYENGTFTAITEADGLLGSIVISIFEDAAGSLWVGTERGLQRYREGRFAASTTPELVNDWIHAIYQDREGSLWVGTNSGGLVQIKDLKFSTLTTREGLSSDAIWPVYEDRQGNLWIGTEDGLNRFRDGEITVYTEADGLSGNIINALWEDAEGSLWIGTDGDGLNRFEDGTFTTYTTDDGLSHDNIVSLYEDKEHRLWIGTANGLNRLVDGRFSQVREGLSSSSVQVIHQDREGHLWFGTSNGLNRYDNGQFRTYTTEDGLSHNNILALHEDAEGTLWIATWGGGLNRFKDGRFTSFTVKDGLLNDNIFQILEDDENGLWLTSNLGIFRVSKAELNAFAEGRAHAVTYTAFDKSDGLRSRECNGGIQPAGWKSRDGRLWFPTPRGLAMIDPAHVNTNRTAPPVVISDVMANDQRVQDGAELPAGYNKVSFRYAALSFMAPEQVRYHVMLEGLDEDWVDAGARREAFYTNLPPGHYTFKVRAANNDGIWSTEAAAVSFYLRPFFYQTAWFLLFCTLAAVLLVVAGYRLRVRQMHVRQKELEALVETRTKDLREEKEKTELALRETEAARHEAEQQKEIAEQQKEIAEEAKAVIEEQAEQLREMDRIKTRFFNNISHEFRTPLTLTIGPLENALTGSYGPLGGILRNQMEIMLRNARRLLRLINQLLDLSKLESGQMELKAQHLPLVPFVECIVLSFTAFAEERGIALQFRAEAECDLYFDPEKLEKIIFNLLSNALKFTPPGGRVEVAIGAAPEGRVGIRVQDTGPGIPREELPHIFDRFHQVDGTTSQVQEGTGIGLSLAKELAELHGGAIEVESEAGKGATFTVLLQRGRAHLKDAQIVTASPAGNGAVSRGPMVEMVVVDPEELSGEVRPHEEGHLTPPGPAARHVLVVDDNRDVREYVRGCLYPAYRVSEAKDGAEGLEKARREQPDLILSDVMMPGMDGYELCRQVKADEAVNHIPIILLTAKASVDMKVEGLEIGADDYMAKPFNARELLARISNLLRLRQQEKELKRLNEHLEERVREQLDLLMDERRRYERKLIAAKEKAEESARLKSTILENMSHEIRTPITAIMGFSQVLADELTDEQREFVGFIEQNSQRLLDTLNAILDLSRLESDRATLQPVYCNLTEIAARAVETFGPAADKKGLALRTAFSPEGAFGRLDPVAVDRILHSLIGNAVKFTEAGEVVVATGCKGPQIYLEVRDTGIGIGEAFRPFVFEAFKQESVGLSRSHEGSGLGLSIAKRLIELMDGRIELESEQGQGSTFRVFFPAAEPLEAEGDLPEEGIRAY